MRPLLLMLALGALACPPAPVCEQLETRCAVDVAQVCDSRGRWQDVMDCLAVEPGDWHCGLDEEEEATCLPQP